MYPWISESSESRRSELATAARLFPTRSAAVSWVRSKSLHEAREALRLLDRVEPLALEILDQPDRRGRGVACLDDPGGDRPYLEQLEGAPAPLSRDQLEPLAMPAHDDRLKETLAPDALGELRELLGRDLAARLERARLDEVHLDVKVPSDGPTGAGWAAADGFDAEMRAPSPRPSLDFWGVAMLEGTEAQPPTCPRG